MNVELYGTEYVFTALRESTSFHIQAEEGLNMRCKGDKTTYLEGLSYFTGLLNNQRGRFIQHTFYWDRRNLTITQ